MISSAKAEDIFPLLWKAIARLELNGLHVLGITADASVNRRVYGERNTLTYKTPNIFSEEKQSILFLFRSIPPAEDNSQCHGKYPVGNYGYIF